MVSSKLFSALILCGLSTSSGLLHAQNLMCCQDPASGRKHCGDSLPAQCKGLAYKVISPAGNVIREVAAPLTEDQKKAKEAEEKKKKEEEERMREQKRKDNALLETYSSVKDIEMAQKRAEEELLKAIELSEKAIETARKKRKALDSELEFYKKSEPPIDIKRKVKDAEDEIKAQQSILESKKADLQNVRAKYAVDKKRYEEITKAGSDTKAHPAGKK